MSNTKRTLLKSLLVGGAVTCALPNQWSTPLVNSVVLPAHAQTSFGADCSGVEEEIVNEPISITVTDTEVQGPVSATRIGQSFSATTSTTGGLCADGVSELSSELEFSGTIDSANNRIVGEFNVRQYCGGVLACEQIATYSVEQNPLDAGSDLGSYEGRLTGTLRCCVDLI